LKRILVALFLGLVAGELRGQEPEATSPESGQIWGNVVLDFPRGERLLLELDFEPKAQVSGSETWRNIDVTPLVEHYPNRWIDLVGETTVGRTRQKNELSTYEVTPRVGARFHILSNLRTMQGGSRPLGRVSIANLVRFEWRNFWYSDGSESHETRVRNRLELKAGLNHRELSSDKTLYLIADFEFFVPLSDDVPERFASKRRTRVGLGYRRDDRLRFEVLFIRDGSRQTLEEDFDTAANILNARLKMFF